MHTPISTLKTAARDSESTTVIELVRRLFNLRDDEEREFTEASQTDSDPALNRNIDRDSAKAKGKGQRD
jgi:hypothetical protein